MSSSIEALESAVSTMKSLTAESTDKQIKSAYTGLTTAVSDFTDTAKSGQLTGNDFVRFSAIDQDLLEFHHDTIRARAAKGELDENDFANKMLSRR